MENLFFTIKLQKRERKREREREREREGRGKGLLKYILMYEGVDRS